MGGSGLPLSAIRLPSFADSPLDVRAEVFYALLVDALEGSPPRQDDVVSWPQFQSLPARDRARLLRLMASRALVTEGDRDAARRWLTQSIAADPSDLRARLLLGLDRTSARLCRAMLRLRTAGQRRRAAAPPYADLNVPGAVPPR